MKRLWLILAPLWCLFFSVHAFATPILNEVVSYCDLTANAKQYEGKYVSVRGTYKFSQDGPTLSDLKCRKARPALLRFAQPSENDRTADERLERKVSVNPYAEVEVVIHGRFREAHQMECIVVLSGCFSYALEDVALERVLETDPAHE